MSDKWVFKNSTYSVLQTIVTAIIALIVFKVMVVHVGLKITGLWSYLASITAITGFGSYGFANALLFYIPKYKLNNDPQKLNSLINTTILSSFLFTTILCVISYVVFILIIPSTVDQNLIVLSYRILPFVILSFLFSGVSASFLFILDGLMLMHVRAKIYMAASIVFLVCGILLILKMGILGIAIAQVIQNLVLLILSFILVKKNIKSYRFAFEFKKIIFKSTFKFGFNFQIISITQIISEPFMKSMITKFAGSEVTAMFDFCVKLLSLFRNLIIAANQTIVPQITIFKVKGHLQRLILYYRANFSLILFLGVIFFLSPIIFDDSISLFFLNQRNEVFNFILINVSFAYLANSIAIPAHFHNVGTGKLKWNVINNIVAAFIILISSPLLGKFVGGKYIIVGWAFSAIIAAMILIASFSRENHITILSFFNLNIVKLLGAMAISFIICKYLDNVLTFNNSLLAMTLIKFIVLFVCLFYPVVTNPTF
ncbi:MAG: lipopolysaccharide biosynthesis protein, partial [Ferruginibacter sp.]